MKKIEDQNTIDLFSSIGYPVLILDSKSFPIWANQKFLSLHEITLADLPDGISQLSLQTLVTSHDYSLHTQDASYNFLLIKSKIVFKSEKATLISFFDITKRVTLNNKLIEKQKMFESLSENLPEGIILYDQKILYSNPMIEKLLGFNGTELRSKTFDQLIQSEDLESYLLNIDKLNTQRKKVIKSTVKLHTKNKQDKWVDIKTSRIIQSDEIVYLNIITDISKEKLEVEKLTKLAYYDPLTNIYNRRKFDELLSLEYKRAKRYERDLCGLFFDIDHFKKVNDTYGHDIGDSVLRELTTTIKKHVRETDFFGRWGGEEFIIILPETTIEKAQVFAEHIRKLVESYNFTKVGSITISLGVTQLKGKEQMETFLKRLDNALYQAKKEGRNKFVLG